MLAAFVAQTCGCCRRVLRSVWIIFKSFRKFVSDIFIFTKWEDIDHGWTDGQTDFSEIDSEFDADHDHDQDTLWTLWSNLLDVAGVVTKSIYQSILLLPLLGYNIFNASVSSYYCVRLKE